MMPGINIQFPWSQKIVTGKKSIETRTYRMPEKYVGREIAIIETPGKTGKFKARIIGTVVFGESFDYKTRAKFAKDYKRHLVPTTDPLVGWPTSGSKWGWPILEFTVLKEAIPAPKPRGIVFASNCKIPKKLQSKPLLQTL